MKHVVALMEHQDEATTMVGEEVSYAQTLVEIHRCAGHADHFMLQLAPARAHDVSMSPAWSASRTRRSFLDGE